MKFTIAIFSIVFSFSNLLAQYEEAKKLSFGVSVGINQSHILDNHLEPMIVENALGFRLGALATYKLNPRLSLTGRSELSFNNGIIYKDVPRLFPFYQEILPYSNEFILHAEFSDTKGRWYALAGPNFKLAIPNTTQAANEFTSNSDIALDIGFGRNLSFFGHALTPQLRYSFGLYGISSNPSFPSSTFNNAALVVSFR